MDPGRHPHSALDAQLSWQDTYPTPQRPILYLLLLEIIGYGAYHLRITRNQDRIKAELHAYFQQIDSYKTESGAYPGGCRQTREDKRYEHIVFDEQLMSSINQGLAAIQKRYSAKVLTSAVYPLVLD